MNEAQAKQVKVGDKLVFTHPRTGRIEKCTVVSVFGEGFAVTWESGDHGDFRFDEADYVEIDSAERVRDELVRYIREDIEAEFDREPDWLQGA